MYVQTLNILNSGADASYQPWTDLSSANQHMLELEIHEPLFCEGDDAAFVYEVLDGVLCNYRLLADGRRQVISFAYPGDLIGPVHLCIPGIGAQPLDRPELDLARREGEVHGVGLGI